MPRQAQPTGAEWTPTTRSRTTAEFSRIPLREKIPATERRAQRASHLTTRSPRSRIRENSAGHRREHYATPSAANRSGVDADNSQSNHRGILTNSATREDSCYGGEERNGPATLPLVPLVAEFVRILPAHRREHYATPAQPTGAEWTPTTRSRTTAEFSRIPLREKIPATKRRAQRASQLTTCS